jgi:hypothetical protein
VLAVCDPDVLIVSVKEIAVGSTGEPAVDWTRWQRTAIDASAKQIYGAERWLQTAERVVCFDGSPGIALPPLSARRVHRIAIALGSVLSPSTAETSARGSYTSSRRKHWSPSWLSWTQLTTLPPTFLRKNTLSKAGLA